MSCVSVMGNVRRSLITLGGWGERCAGGGWVTRGWRVGDLGMVGG